MAQDGTFTFDDVFTFKDGETDETSSAAAADVKVLTGTEGDDLLEGGSGDEQLFGLAGWDTLLGGGGDDALFGGKGRDYLHGWKGDNGLYGGAGRDTIFIDNGNNYVETGKGADTVILDFEGGRGAIADFSVGADTILLASDSPENPPSVQDLIDDGSLKIRGDEFHTVIRFGDTKIDLLGVSVEDFNLDLISVA